MMIQGYLTWSHSIIGTVLGIKLVVNSFTSYYTIVLHIVLLYDEKLSETRRTDGITCLLARYYVLA